MTDLTLAARDILRQAFPGIPGSEVDEMVKTVEPRTCRPGVVLCQEGAVEDAFYIILEGRVEVTKHFNEAENRVLKVLKPGDFFGEMGLIHNAARAATVTTLEPTTVLSIHKKDFDKLLQLSSSVSLAMVREVSRRLRENDEMAIEDLRLKAGELANAYQRLAQEDFTRREFLTHIAHELRNPLTAASGFLEIARSGSQDQDLCQDALLKVRQNLEQVISLANDILFLQEVELVLPEMHAQDMGEIVQYALDRVFPLAEIRQIHLDVQIAPDLPHVKGHFNSLVKAVTKVLDNAIKFSSAGGEVQVSVERGNQEIRVRVADHGIGIPANLLPNIFGRFFHIEEKDDQWFDGLGLGLAITKQVIEQHDGRIEVESEVGAGSTFTIILDVPLAPIPDYKV